MKTPTTSKLIATSLLLCFGALLGGCYNLHQVGEDGIYRSSQPLEEDLTAWIRTYGIKTVLKLNGGNPGEFWFEQTNKLAEERRVTVVVVPMSATRFPSQEQLLKVWDVLETADRPILIHCREGADRTGLVSGISVLHRGGTPEEAMEQLAFVPYWHSGLFDTAAMGNTIELYSPWYPELGFREWASEHYRQLASVDEFQSELERQRAMAAAFKSNSRNASPQASR